MPREQQPHNHSESQTMRNRGGEPSGTPPTDRTESSQPQMVRLIRMVPKRDLAIYQGAADALTQAGLGTYSYTVAEQQTIPLSGIPLGEDSPFVVATYSGQANRDKLLSLVDRAMVTKQDTEREGKPQEEVNQAVQDTIR